MASKIYESAEIKKINKDFYTVFGGPQSDLEFIRDYYEEQGDAPTVEKLNRIIGDK